MTQAQIILDLISQKNHLAAQAGTIYILCEDGSQLALDYMNGDRDTQYIDQVITQIIEPRQD